MKNMNRRTMIKNMACGAAVVGVAGCTSVAGSGARVVSKSMYPKSAGSRVVVVGGGFGGTSAARSVKQEMPDAEVILLEKNNIFNSCPMSNLFLGGLMPLYLTDYAPVGKEGVDVIQTTVTDIDRKNKMVFTANGSLSYDKLVLSPGIDFMYDKIKGLAENLDRIPIGWKDASGRLALKHSLEDFEEGTFVISIPKGPIRCPPGPYERASMIAWHIKNSGKKAKLVILDANPKPMSKGKGFLAAWKKHYSDIIDYQTDQEVISVDAEKQTMTTSFGDTVSYDACNVIPPMMGGALIRIAGVGERWAKVNPLTFQSVVDPDVYVVGDSASVPKFPKSGYMANSVGTACGKQIALALQGKEPEVPRLSNICFSTVEGSGEVGTAINVEHAFDWDAANKKWGRKSKVNLDASESVAQAGREWADGIWYNVWGRPLV